MPSSSQSAGLHENSQERASRRGMQAAYGVTAETGMREMDRDDDGELLLVVEGH